MNEELQRLQAQCVEAYAAGGYVGAAPFAERIVAIVDRWWLHGDAGAMLVAAQMRYFLARAALDQGRPDEGRAHLSRGFRAVTRAERLGDPRWTQQRLLLLVSRAEARMSGGDHEGALVDLVEAEAIENLSNAPDWGESQVHMRLAMQYALQELGRFDESLRQASVALELASEHEPRLVPAALQRMSLVRRLTGAGDDGDHHLRAADAIARAQDIGGPERAELARSLASRALEVGDLDAATAHLDEAEREFLAIGDLRRAAAAGVGRADVLRQRGRLDDAIEAAAVAVVRAAELGERSAQLEGWTVTGMAHDDAGRGERALEAHARARAIAEGEGDALQLIRIDLRRGVAALNAGVRAAQADQAPGSAFGAAASPRTSSDFFALAADIALPAALAADAVRFGMEAGAVRESWARELSTPVADVALRALTALGRADEIVALLEYVAAAAALDPAPRESAQAGEAPRSLPDRLALPPYVRTDPAGGSAIDGAIAAARERYGVAVRGDEEVTAW